MKIVLIGFACCYKTSAGKLLAEKLKYKHIDVDDVVERLAAKSVAEIFESEGEQAFRRYERHALESLYDCCDVVISCGGGSALADNFEQLANGAAVVWLTANADTVLSRLGNIPRPLFDGKNAYDISRLMDIRSPYYAKYAALTIATDGLTSQQVAEVIFYNAVTRV